MKKLLVLALALILTGLFALAEAPVETQLPAENEAPVYSVGGVVTEITAESFYLIQTEDMGPVLVQTAPETVYDTDREIALGDYITVIYNGVMSRSIPAQITAELIRMYSITGQIVAADPEVNGVLLQTETHGEVYAFLPEPWLENTAETLTVYFDGAMTMSIPPQIGADWVVSLGE